MALAVRDTLGEAEGLTPLVSDAVGAEDTVLLPDCVEEGVGAAVPLPLPVGVPVGVGVGVGAAVALPETELLPMFEGEAPLVREAVGEALSVVLLDRVLLAVAEAVPVAQGLGLPVLVAMGVLGAVLLPLLERGSPPDEGGSGRARHCAAGQGAAGGEGG